MNQRSFHPHRRRLLWAALAVVAVAAAWGATRVFIRHAPVALALPFEAVARRDIAQTVEATGTVQPVEVVEIKSKASGQILRMPVQIGSVVRAGDLLAQIDTVTVQNQYNQALAELKAAEAAVEITGAQKKRADELLSREVMTADQNEAATLAYANAQSQIARAKSDLEIAAQALKDATVRAPESGTVIEQDVVKGQVIASATSSASGGTTLLKMADLNRVQMEALVGETDIGSVRPGQAASVTVDAFPRRPFQGEVVKIEPQAVVQQSVTMFPVLISIANENGLLLPGMNGEVTVSIDTRSDVLAVPLDAVRTARELPAVASALGLNTDSLKASVQRQIGARVAARTEARGDSSRVRGRGAGSGAWGGGAGWRRGGPRAAGGPGAQVASAGAGGNGRAGQAQIVFVRGEHGLEPRLVRLGISDFDYAQVVDGLGEGDEVALLSVAEVQAKRKQDQSRIQQRMGSGIPGAPAAGGGGGGRGAGGGR